MAYVKKTWADNPTGNTPITAAALNNLETQYDQVVANFFPVSYANLDSDVQSRIAAGGGGGGVTPVISVAATTLTPGSTATVVKTGTDAAPTFTFGIPRGDVGQTGAPGSGSGTGGTIDNMPRAMRDFMVLRGVTPARFAVLGSSTPAGSTATTVDNRVVNRWLKMMQSAYPAPSGTTEQSTSATLDGPAVSAGGIQMYNGAVSGYTSSNYADSTTIGKVVALNPRVIVHWVGSNDYAANVNPTTYAANVKGVIDSIDASLTSPHVHLVIQAHERYDVTGRTYTWDSYGVAAQTMAAAQTKGNVFCVDISGYFKVLGIAPSTQYGTDVLGLMNADKVHMLDQGHALMAEALSRQLGVLNTPQAALVQSDVTAPTVPSTPTATAGTTSATLAAFATSTDAVGVVAYDIYSSADSYASAIASTTSAPYTISSLPAGTAVSFKVAARDAAGNRSAQSAASNTVTPTASTGPDTTPPGATTLTVKPKAASALLTWTAASDDTGVTNYRVFRDGTTVTTVGNVLTYTDGSLTNGTRYSYTVAAMDAAGNIGAQSTAVLTVPGAIVDNFDRTAGALTGQTLETGQTWTSVLSHTLDILPTGLVKRNYTSDSSATTGRAMNLFAGSSTAASGYKLAIKLGAAPASASLASGGPAFGAAADGSSFYYLGLRQNASTYVYALFLVGSVGAGPGSQSSVSTVQPQNGDLLEIVRTAGTTTWRWYINGVDVTPASTPTTGFPAVSSTNNNYGLYQNGDAVFEYDWISYTAL